jgi:hypothetical protein
LYPTRAPEYLRDFYPIFAIFRWKGFYGSSLGLHRPLEQLGFRRNLRLAIILDSDKDVEVLVLLKVPFELVELRCSRKAA